MGVAALDYDCDGQLDIVKTNFAGDTTSLYHNIGKMLFDDQTFQAGLGKNTRFLGWGVGFLDFDNDGWPDIFICNGHVYPEVVRREYRIRISRAQGALSQSGQRHICRCLLTSGPGFWKRWLARGCAFGDFDNDGDVDVLVNCINDVPQLLRCDRSSGNNWLKLKTIGVKSNRSGIGARIIVRPRAVTAKWTKCGAVAVTSLKAI